MKLDAEFYIHLNKLLAIEQALDVGHFRNGNVIIGCIDGTIPPPSEMAIKKSLKAIASINKTIEANVSHHFAFRGCDDVTYIISASVQPILSPVLSTTIIPFITFLFIN